MTLPPCDICCNGDAAAQAGNSPVSYRGWVLSLLCRLLSATSEIVDSSSVVLCDDTGAPVIVRTRYTSEGVPIVDSITAYYVTGLEYTGDLADLVACGAA